MSLRCTFQTIDKVDSLNKAQEMAWKGYSFVQLLATRTDNGIDMVYTYRNGEDMPSFKIKNIKETDSIASITPVFFNAFVFENEVHDLFGVRIQGICVDFKGRFYDVTVDKSMTVVSPELKKRKDRKAKVAKAKSVSFSKKNNESSIDKNSKVHKEEAR